MTFTTKLEKLTADRDKRQTSVAAGLPATAISNAIAKGHTPRSDTALRLARAMDVPVEWLIDDEQDWPPPKQQSIASLSTEELTHELGRRMQSVGIEMLILIHRAWQVDWVSLAKVLLAADVNAPLPAKVQKLIEIPGQLNSLERHFRHYDPEFTVGDDAPAELLKEVKSPAEFGMIELMIWHRNFDDTRGYRQAASLAGLFLAPPEYRPPWFAENVAHTKAEAAAALAALPPEKPSPFAPRRKPPRK